MQLIPTLIAHADWGSATKKRTLAVARLSDRDTYRVSAPRLVENPSLLLDELAAQASPSGSVLVGFDFPIGLPLHYANRVGMQDFKNFLTGLGHGNGEMFYQVAAKPEEISLKRPFYPLRSGSSKQSHLLQALGAASMDDLRRLCERAGMDDTGITHRAACPLFWTLGGQQVGKAAILGWSQVIGPALRDPSLKVGLWPFDGDLDELIMPGGLVVLETYPAEFYHHLGIRFSNHKTGSKTGKRVQAERQANASRLIEWAHDNQIEIEPPLEILLMDGFGNSANGDDYFDAVVGLFGMINIISGNHPSGIPEGERIRKIEGWIFGKMKPLCLIGKGCFPSVT
jgi:hypothetical protein